MMSNLPALAVSNLSRRSTSYKLALAGLQAALKGIEKYKTTEYIDSLIENLPIFEWLKKVERTDLSGIY
jgi:hypothetical protein